MNERRPAGNKRAFDGLPAATRVELERAYNAYIPIFNEAPYPTPDGVKTMLDDLARSNPKAAAADPNKFVDQSLVRELETSGFIKRLYKK